jgi:hypothetical protein
VVVVAQAQQALMAETAVSAVAAAVGKMAA